MAIVAVSSSSAFAFGSLIELEEIGTISMESIAKLVESQRELFHSQIDQLQNIVVTQCKLTGVNPLSQEMAAGALSINIGKKPRDLLNPKAVKYFQLLFSIKDTIGKKETREISALCGITATQVKDYFASQRSRVRKLVRLSKEKATRSDTSKETSDASKETIDGCSAIPNQSELAYKDVPIHTTEHSTPATESSENVTPICMQYPGDPVNIYPVFTQPSGNLGYVSMPDSVNSSDVTTLCTAVPGVSGNFAMPLAVSGNFSRVCTVVPGVSGNVTTACTPVPGDSIFRASVFAPVPLNSVSVPAADTHTLVNGNSMTVSTVRNGQPLLMKTGLKPGEEGLSCPLPEENTPGIDNDDKKFLENIFNLMRKEQTFAGQVKLMESVLQIHNSAVLNWFSTKGGVTILATWLCEAALEEQTTVLLVIFKVLCHLPLNKAQPVQMSAILQTINRLRFYRNSDISNRAKVLLSRWSKMFVRSQALRNSSKNAPKNGQKEIQKQRTSEVLGDESWSSELDIPGGILALAESTEDSRETEPKKALKLLTESGEGLSKKHERSVSVTKIKERRKVLLVEQLDIKAGRSVQMAKAVPSNHSRPMSVDDIQKAKMRAIYMQDKYRKNNASTSENYLPKLEDQKVLSPPQNGSDSHVKKLPLPQPRREEAKKPSVTAAENLSNKLENSISQKSKLTYEELLREKLKKNQIQWCTSSEVRISSSWRVRTGENSKEVQIQTERNKREKETFYKIVRDIPPNPKEPWDIEMDFDDTLTPEIPIDQPPDSEIIVETANENRESVSSIVLDSDPLTSSMSTTATTVATNHVPERALGVVGPTLAAEPDAELLQVLLRNPDVVEALTRGEGRNLTEEQLVALLDMVKKAGTGLAIGMTSQPHPDPEPTSLPSPTPPTDAERIAWRSPSALQPQFSGNRAATTLAPSIPYRVPSSSPSTYAVNSQTPVHIAANKGYMQTPGLASQAPSTIMSHPYLMGTPNPTAQQYQPIQDSLPTKVPSMYVSSRYSPRPETFIPSTNNHHHHKVNNNSSFPTLHPGQWNQPQSEPPVWRDPVPDPGYCANNNNYNTTSAQNSHSNMYGRRNGFVGRPDMETWSEESPVRLPEFQYDHSTYLEQRRGGEWSGEWSRQRLWSSGQWNEYQQGGAAGGSAGNNGGGRWQDHSGGRGRGR